MRWAAWLVLLAGSAHGAGVSELVDQSSSQLAAQTKNADTFLKTLKKPTITLKKSKNRCSLNSSCLKAPQGDLVVLVSLSMPMASLQDLFWQTQKLGGRLVIRGLVNNSFKDTQRKIRELGIIVDIDPSLFKKHSVTQVPVFIKRGKTIAGNVTASYALAHLKEGGVHAQTFAISEQDFLEVLQARLNKLDPQTLEEHQAQIQKRVRKSIQRPNPVAGLVRAQKYRRWSYDPSLRVSKDIKDQHGKIIVKAGTTVNPLQHLSWGKPLLLIDGDDTSQVTWAQSQEGDIVLVKGAPLKLEERLKQPVYFDQGGKITARFEIKATPARINQWENELVIEELPA